MKDLWYTPNVPDDTGWRTRHLQAIRGPHDNFEAPIVFMLKAWLDYAEKHQDRYESPIGEDGVLGPAWAQIGDGIRQLLNGDCGRLDCGTIDSIIHDNLAEQGFSP